MKILYTGDFSCEKDRHLMAAEMPLMKPDVLIIEATYGIKVHEPREERERRFTQTVYETVTRGGRCLIPVFALGRAQELLLILDEYWSAHPELHEIPIYYASAMAKKCMAVYQVWPLTRFFFFFPCLHKKTTGQGNTFVPPSSSLILGLF